MKVSKRQRNAALLYYVFIVFCVLLLSGCGNHLPWPASEDNAKQSFDAIEIQEAANHSVVRIISNDNSSGTGFVLRTKDPSNIYIFTNYHVIGGGTHFRVEMKNDDNHRITISSEDVEVVKVDSVADLALLKTPNIGTEQKGLLINVYRPTVAQPILVLGFPGVDNSEFELTAEDGKVTATKRTVGKRSYVQINANVNPGNSGGPVLDAEAMVMGLVVATMVHTERTNLVIPAEKLFELADAYFSPEITDAETQIENVLADFFDSLRYNEPMESAGALSRDFLLSYVRPALEEELQSAGQKYARLVDAAAQNGIDLVNSPAEYQIEVMSANLEQTELEGMALYSMYNGGQISLFQALQAYMSLFLPSHFGEIISYNIERIEISDDGQSADVRVQVQTSRGSNNITIAFQYQWGDWRIMDYTVI